jgi:hypothetical protein
VLALVSIRLAFQLPIEALALLCMARILFANLALFPRVLGIPLASVPSIQPMPSVLASQFFPFRDVLLFEALPRMPAVEGRVVHLGAVRGLEVGFLLSDDIALVLVACSLLMEILLWRVPFQQVGSLGFLPVPEPLPLLPELLPLGGIGPGFLALLLFLLAREVALFLRMLPLEVDLLPAVLLRELVFLLLPLLAGGPVRGSLRLEVLALPADGPGHAPVVRLLVGMAVVLGLVPLRRGSNHRARGADEGRAVGRGVRGGGVPGAGRVRRRLGHLGLPRHPDQSRKRVSHVRDRPR